MLDSLPHVQPEFVNLLSSTKYLITVGRLHLITYKQFPPFKKFQIYLYENYIVYRIVILLHLLFKLSTPKTITKQ